MTLDDQLDQDGGETLKVPDNLKRLLEAFGTALPEPPARDPYREVRHELRQWGMEEVDKLYQAAMKDCSGKLYSAAVPHLVMAAISIFNDLSEYVWTFNKIIGSREINSPDPGFLDENPLARQVYEGLFPGSKSGAERTAEELARDAEASNVRHEAFLQSILQRSLETGKTVREIIRDPREYAPLATAREGSLEAFEAAQNRFVSTFKMLLTKLSVFNATAPILIPAYLHKELSDYVADRADIRDISSIAVNYASDLFEFGAAIVTEMERQNRKTMQHYREILSQSPK